MGKKIRPINPALNYNNRYRLPTKGYHTYDCCGDKNRSDRIIKPTELPLELNGIITFEQYLTISNSCKKIIDYPKFVIYTTLLVILLIGVLAIPPFLIDKKLIAIILLIISGSLFLISLIVFSIFQWPMMKKRLDKEMISLNSFYSENNIYISYVDKIYASGNKTRTNIKVYIHYNETNKNIIITPSGV